MTKNNCPYCNSRNITTYIECTDYFLSQEPFHIMECTDCGIRFTHPVPAPENMGAYYKSEKYFSHSNSRQSLMGIIYNVARHFTLAGKRRLVNSLISDKNNRSILDIGCGTGHFLHTMQEAGWQAKGYEISTEAVQFACSHFNLNVLPAPQLMDETGTFKIITLWHVLEHVQDLSGYLNKIHSILDADGRLILALPNPESYDAHHYGKYWGGYDVPRHLWHFTPTFVEKLCTQHGFKLLKYKTMPLDAFYVSMLSERYAGHTVPLIRGIRTGINGWLAVNKKGKEKSSSLIYIIQKS